MEIETEDRLARLMSNRRLLHLLLAMMALYSTLSLGRAISRFLGPEGGLDFHSYWYSGHFVRQGDNPYRAFLEKEQIQFPVRFLDGPVVEEPPVAQPGLPRTPANTAPLLLALSSFSFLSWTVAKGIWFVFCLLSAALIPWLVIRLLPAGWLNIEARLFITLAFYAFTGTRVAIWMGQTTLPVLLLLMIAILTWRKGWFIAGIALGFALSKYSLALPVFLFALYRRKYRVALLSAAVQLAGILAIVLLGGDSPLAVVDQYIHIARFHAALQGEACFMCIHLAALLPPHDLVVDVAIGFAAGFGLLLFGAWLRRSGRSLRLKVDEALIDLNILSVLVLWSLLAGYHRAYDSEYAIIFVAFLVAGSVLPGDYAFSPVERRLSWLAVAALITILVLPGEIASRFLSDNLYQAWLTVVNAAITLGLASALVLALILLRRILARQKVEINLKGGTVTSRR